jgi:glycosyltransferase involved in cell wall biosynthesis
MEAAPNAVLEAMAAGLPVVATRVGGIPEVLNHERNGLLVAPGDSGELATAILRLMDEPDLGARLGSAARQTIDARFSFARMTEEFEALYLTELAQRTRHQPLAWAASSGH